MDGHLAGLGGVEGDGHGPESVRRIRGVSTLLRQTKGESGNPAGRKNAGLSLIEWYNETANWSLTQLREFAEDERNPAVRVAAARRWIDAMSGDRTKLGTPIGGTELDRIADRLIGKPQTRVDVTSGDEPIKAYVGVPVDGDDAP